MTVPVLPREALEEYLRTQLGDTDTAEAAVQAIAGDTDQYR